MDTVRLANLEEEARRVLPPTTFAYFRQGARDGVTAGEAVEAWARYRFVPRVLRDVRDVATTATLLGSAARAPLGVAPTTLQRAADPGGELAMAAACATSGIPLVLSSNATARFEDVGATGVTWWLQAYLTQDRDLCRPMLQAAAAAGATAIVLTLDTPVVGTKYDAGEGTVWDAVPPEWLRVNLGAAADAPKAQDLGPGDIGWIAEVTGLPVVPKGVLHPDDARGALRAGAAAIWVSNHGGRQLDRAAATADCLSGVVEAVGNDVEVYVDGGIRSGLSALAALALGARACFVGRLPLYALAAGGQEGVEHALAQLVAELEEAIRLAGCHDPGSVRGLLGPPRGGPA
ncbi:4-hydroxymandelate oxidase [Marmoricola sp. URHA0025 HA25]